MGYQTRITVVMPWSFTDDPPMGEELATLDLCKCHGGAVGDLIASKTVKAKSGTKPPFGLCARNPQRQHEVVDILRRCAAKGLGMDGLSPDQVNELASDLEDGKITTDCYGDYLGVIGYADFVAALEKDIAAARDAGDEPYRRFVWAYDLLRSIRATFTQDIKIITYGH
jgi:hypothetical protein